MMDFGEKLTKIHTIKKKKIIIVVIKFEIILIIKKEKEMKRQIKGQRPMCRF